MNARPALCLVAAAVFALPSRPGAQEVEVNFERVPVPKSMTAEEAAPALDRALDWFVREQHENGSWGEPVLGSILEAGFSIESYYAWQVSAHAMGVMAMLAAEETPERRQSLDKALRWLCTTRFPKRGSDWDNDSVWAYLYGLEALTRVATDPRYSAGELAELVAARGREFQAALEKNQVPDGGWAYYDDPIYSQRPKWSTSFCTALILPALDRSRELGWSDDGAVLARAIKAVWSCAMPEGAWNYNVGPVAWVNGGEHINRVKGSLGRTQVCNWGLARVGEKKITQDRVRDGLKNFFEHHRFLDVARMRPIPHEAYYANAGYFYLFGHYYAAEAIELLPAEEREAWHAQLRPHLVKVQYADGDSTDFLGTSYMRVSGTAFTALALQLGMDEGGSGLEGTKSE